MKHTPPNWLLALLSVIAAVLLLEAALAVFWPHKIVPHPYHEQYHPVLGWANKPNVAGEVRVGRDVAFYRSHNSLGLRSLREIPYTKRPGVTRVLLLGDSFFWGFGVDDNDVVSEVLQRKAGAGYEVVNGSVVGYGTDQELLWLVEEGLKFRPDIVVIGVFPTNDTDEISRSVMYHVPKPFFSVEKGALSAHNIPVPDTRETRRKAFEQPDTLFGKLKKVLRHHTHLYPFLAARLNALPVMRELFVAVGMGDEFTAALPGVPDYRLQQEQVPDLFDALILEVKRTSERAGARFILLHIPKREWEPGSGEGRSIQDARDWNDSWSRELRDFSRRYRIEYIDLLPVVREQEGRNDILYTRSRSDHHWTVLGNATAAEVILDRLHSSPGKGEHR